MIELLRFVLAILASPFRSKARLEAEWQRATSLKRPIALMMIDVDHFKLFNDNYGHVEGDQCLRVIGDALATASSHKADFAARYGGEEFVLLLPGMDASAALKVGERLRKAIEDSGLAHAKAPCGHVTVSIGVASLRPQPDEPPQVLVEAADAALYAAKRRGRNRVVTHEATRLPLAS